MKEQKYKVEQWDSRDRFLVLKPDETAYLVELNYFGVGHHACFCRWFECHAWNKPVQGGAIPHCVHIRAVQAHLREQAKALV